MLVFESQAGGAAQEGMGADVFSAGELSVVRMAGIPRDKILFNGNSKSEIDHATALQAGATIVFTAYPTDIIQAKVVYLPSLSAGSDPQLPATQRTVRLDFTPPAGKTLDIGGPEVHVHRSGCADVRVPEPLAYLADQRAKMIEEWNLDTGDYLRTLGISEGTLENPTNVVIDESRDRLYVCDSHKHGIVAHAQRGARSGPGEVALDEIEFRQTEPQRISHRVHGGHRKSCANQWCRGDLSVTSVVSVAKD